MLNLLRSDFYRLFKSKSYYICMIVEFLLMIIGIVALYLLSKTDSTLASVMPESGLSYGISAFSDADISMILGIIVAIFVVAEFSHGTMKNVVSKGFSKISIYFSKYITMLAATYIFLFATMLVGTISATIVTGKLGTLTGDMFKIMGIEMLLFAALVAFYLLVSMVIKNLGGVIAINIIYTIIIESLLFNILQLIVKNKVEFTKYSLINNIAFYSSDTITGSDFLRSALVALVYFAITIALGLFIFKKSDVK